MSTSLEKKPHLSLIKHLIFVSSHLRWLLNLLQYENRTNKAKQIERTIDIHRPLSQINMNIPRPTTTTKLHKRTNYQQKFLTLKHHPMEYHILHLKLLASSFTTQSKSTSNSLHLICNPSKGTQSTTVSI